jgi:predicted ribosome quality control (RQC) complex YloA/Tae2 family protein
MKSLLERLARKIAMQEDELLATRNKEELRWRGDMVTANLYRLEKGMTEFTATDYFHEPFPEVTLSLDPLKPPAERASFYKAYAKARTAEVVLARQLETERVELNYWKASWDELSARRRRRYHAEIRRETDGRRVPAGKDRAQKRQGTADEASSFSLRYGA